MRDVVQIWQIPLQVLAGQSDDLINRYRGCLSQDEKNKANRFRFPADRRRFVIARGTLRHLLGRQLNQRPEQVVFYYGAYGKPSVRKLSVSLADQPQWSLPYAPAGEGCELHFNLSHSGEIALCALGYGRRVGVDIEQVKTIRRLDGMMKRSLVMSEQRQVEAESVAARSRAFLQRWTCKEAYLKAIGLGLTQSMQTVEVQLDPPELLSVPEDCPAGWRLHLMNLPAAYVGALAVAGETAVTQHQWSHLRPNHDD